MSDNKKLRIPEQYLPIIPYLIVNNGKGFLEFTKLVFNSKEQMIVPTEDEKILHAEIRIFDAVIMFGDAGKNWKEKTAAMYLYVDDVKKVFDLAIKNKAKILEEPQKKDYGYSASFEDPYGNFWFIVEAEA